MEKQLMDALKCGSIDEVSQEMIKARVKRAGAELDAFVHAFADKLHQMFEEYDEEYKMLGSTVVLYYKDRLFEISYPASDQFEISSIHGYVKYVEQMTEDLSKLRTRKGNNDA